MRCVTFIILPTVIADAQHSRHLPCNALESTQLHYYLTVQVHDLINPAVSKCLKWPARFLRVLGTFGRPRFSEAANLGISYRHPIWA